MKHALKTILVIAGLALLHTGIANAQVVENNSSVPLNFTVVIGSADNTANMSEYTYKFTLAPHTSRAWRGGVIVSSTVSDGSYSYTVRPGDELVAPLYGDLKNIGCATLKKTVWDHEQL